MKRIVKTLLLAVAVAMAVAPSGFAALLTVDQIIFQSVSGINSSLLSGTIDYTASGNTATIVLTNTSSDAAFTNSSSPAAMLLSNFGLQLPGVDIVSGTVSVTLGSTALNFDAGQSLTNISNQYNYANQSADGFNLAGVLVTDTYVSSVNNGQSTRFAGPPPVTIDGPDYGALSALETQFGSSTAAVQDSVTLVLNFDGAAPSFDTVNAGNVVLSFGSPDTVGGGGHVPDGGATAALLGLGLAGLGGLRARFGRK
jgi:hypothetical protein